MDEIFAICNVKRIHNAVQKYGKKQSKDLKDYSTSYIIYVMFGFFYLFLCIVGLMSSQWILFGALLLLGLIPKKWITWRYIDGTLSIVILLFILLNKYHFHIIFYSLF